MASEAQELEQIALEVAQAAGQLVLQGFRRKLTISNKGPHAELFTEYDVRSEALVRDLLERRTPGIAIVGEESGGQAGPDLTWYIDPIDGTINYIAGHPFFAVSVGVMRGTDPVAGAVVAPALNVEWFGSVERGARRNNIPCRVSPATDLAEAVVTTGFPNRTGVAGAEDALRLAQYARLCNTVRDVRRGGSAAIDLCFVADGTYEVSWMRRISPWDIAAGSALVLGAGGTFEELEYGSPAAQYLTTNGHLNAGFKRMLEGVG